MKSPVRVTITGAAGQIGYALAFRIASGQMLGDEYRSFVGLYPLPIRHGMTIGEILNIGASCLATVFTAIAMILFYYDIRLRKEGFDLRMMAENL